MLKNTRILLENNNFPKHILNKIFNGVISTDTDSSKIKNNNNNEIALSNFNTLSEQKIFTGLKDKIKKEKNSNLIYKIPCKDCDKCYIGETKQLLQKRLNQHKNDIKNNKENTALAVHANIEKHNFDFEATKILDFENNSKKRKISECIYILINITQLILKKTRKG